MADFKIFPTTPNSAPNTDYQIANKKYVDDIERYKITATYTTNLVVNVLNQDSVQAGTANNRFYIDGEWRLATTNLTDTLSSGTNWFNAGSSELRNKDIQLFVYVGWRAAGSEVFFGLSRRPGGTTYADFSSTSTDDGYFAYSSASTPASTDKVEVVGRINAQLNGSNAWVTPTTTKIINRPIYETDWLRWQPTYSGSGSMTYTSVTEQNNYYRINSNQLSLKLRATGTTGGTASNTLNFTMPYPLSVGFFGLNVGYVQDGPTLGGLGFNTSTTELGVRKYDSSNFGLGTSRAFYAEADCKI